MSDQIDLQELEILNCRLYLVWQTMLYGDDEAGDYSKAVGNAVHEIWTALDAMIEKGKLWRIDARDIGKN